MNLGPSPVSANWQKPARMALYRTICQVCNERCITLCCSQVGKNRKLHIRSEARQAVAQDLVLSFMKASEARRPTQSGGLRRCKIHHRYELDPS